MIRIDHIDFEFSAPDESFAYGLYADWDGFCHRCFEQVVEECLYEYDRDRLLYEVERLELDLGHIPEEDFYLEFPRRLKEELLKALPPVGTHTTDEGKKSIAARCDNLLFFLRYGYSKPEWADRDFSPDKEVEWLCRQSSAVHQHYIKAIARLCIENGQILRCLLWQTETTGLHLRVYTAVLYDPVADMQEKRRFLALMLEERPEIPVRFVHESRSDENLRGMASLLDSHVVKQLMHTEMREHAEVNIPPYWHYLYEWLIRYYPFNGLAIFGGKQEFVRHLHHRLLTFIRKRSDSPYLSKTELTVSFLLEVFGPSYYIEVLNAIYNLQPRHADGSPVYDGYFNRELYRVFMQLSLLRLPTVTEQETTREASHLREIPYDAEEWTAFLQDTQRSEADKRYLLEMWTRQQPETVLRWLREMAIKDRTLISRFSELVDDAMTGRLLASLSFTAVETAERIWKHLERQRAEISWLHGTDETGRKQVFRRTLLLWMADGDIKADTLFRLLHQEVAGGRRDDTAMVPLAEAIKRMEEENPLSGGEGNRVALLRGLKKVVLATDCPETAKRRAVAAFWEAYREDYAGAVILLYGHKTLPDVLRLNGQAIEQEIIRSLTMQAFGTKQAGVLLPLFAWLIARGAELSHPQASNGGQLNGRLLWWLATQAQQGTKRQTAENIRHLFGTLWGETYFSALIEKMTESVLLEGDPYGIEAVIALLQDKGKDDGNILPLAFHEWSQHHKDFSNSVQILFESDWKTAEGLRRWLEDSTIRSEYKRNLLQMAVTAYPQEWRTVLRKTAGKREMNKTLTDFLPVSAWWQGMAKINFFQASVLRRMTDRLEQYAETFPFAQSGHFPLSSALSKALLFYMQDTDTLGRTLSEKEIQEKFLEILYTLYIGQTAPHEDSRWVEWSENIFRDERQAGSPECSEQGVPELLADPNTPAMALQHTLLHLLERKPERLLNWLEREADREQIRRIAGITGSVMLQMWVTYLTTAVGFSHPKAFLRLIGWLMRSHVGSSRKEELADCLFAWIKETDWRKQTPQQMERYFFARLYDGSHNLFRFRMERLSDGSLSETLRNRVLRHLLRFRPQELLEYIRHSVSTNQISPRQWTEWIVADDWMSLAASLSLSITELFRQVTEVLHLDEQAQRQVWSAILITKGIETEWAYNSPVENIRSFVQVAADRKDLEETNVEEAVRHICEELHIREAESPAPDVPDCFPVGNAGLCLLAPWFVRLFGMLGYLDEERKRLKDTASKVRAVFLLQYIIYGEEREYRETELLFNRLLTGLSRHIPLPKRLSLTEEERQTADNMIEGVKANWPRMGGTSVQGFRLSFIARNGTLEQQEKRWLLSVEQKAYDILLDTVPWGFRQIRLPWLKKYIQVFWYEKQSFDR